MSAEENENLASDLAALLVFSDAIFGPALVRWWLTLSIVKMALFFGAVDHSRVAKYLNLLAMIDIAKIRWYTPPVFEGFDVLGWLTSLRRKLADYSHSYRIVRSNSSSAIGALMKDGQRHVIKKPEGSKHWFEDEWNVFSRFLIILECE